MAYIPNNMQWLSFFGPRRPVNGQKIYYYGEHIGVHKGRYEIHHDDLVSPHIIICEEERDEELDAALSKYGLNNLSFMVDRMDAPWWMPYEGQDKPVNPETLYPKDYPS